MKKISVEDLKVLIEKIEMIPNENLGIILSQNNLGHNCLNLYMESKDSLGIDHLLILLKVFYSFNGYNCHTENEGEFAGAASTKRELLNCLNANYLIAKGCSEVKRLVKELEWVVSKVEPGLLDISVDKSAKANMLRSLSLIEYKDLVFVDNNEMAGINLLSNLLKKECKLEYDYFLFSDFNKNFKYCKPINEIKRKIIMKILLMNHN